MKTLDEILTSSFNFVMGKATERKICESIDPNRLIGERFAGQALVSDQSYFQITLAEMFIRDQREYWVTFLPFVLMLAEFTFDNEVKSVPVFAGQDFQFLKSIEKFIHGESVEYKNIPLIGPTPYSGGGIKLFTGLFRTKNEDLSSRIFDVVNAVARVAPVAELSLYMALAAPLEKGITSILGIKDVQLRIGVAQNIKDNSDPNPTTAGYIVLVNATEKVGNFWVQNGELWIGQARPEMRFREADYCLFRLDFPRERAISDLSFAKLWNQIKTLVWQNDVAKAEALLLELGRQLAVSPDLTTPHRFQLIALYKVNLEREIELWNQTRSPSQPAFKGASDRLGGKDAIKRLLTQLPPESETRRSVASLAANWGPLMEAYGTEERDLTDKVLQRQMATLANSAWSVQAPHELLDVLAKSVIK